MFKKYKHYYQGHIFYTHQPRGEGMYRTDRCKVCGIAKQNPACTFYGWFSVLYLFLMNRSKFKRIECTRILGSYPDV